MSYIEEIKHEIRVTGGIVDRLIERMISLGPAADRAADIPSGLFEGLDVRKLNSAALPPELGGLPVLQAGVARCLLMEMLGYADPALAVALPGPSLALPPILGMASPSQRREILGRFDSAEPVWGAFAITEPTGGSAAANLQASASAKDGGFVLEGEKCLIGNGGRASFFVVFASTDPARGQFGIQPFVVDRNCPGLTVDDSAPMLGLRAVRVATLRFDGCWIPESRLLVGPDERRHAGAFLAAQRTWDFMRPGLSGMIVGGLERALDEIQELACDQAGHSISAAASSLVTRIRPQVGSVRLLAHRAAALFDMKEDSTVMGSMAKVTASNLACEMIREALLIVGSAGLGTHDVGRNLERWMRDFQAFELMEGTTEVHQLRITKGWAVRSRRLRRAQKESSSPGVLEADDLRG